MRNYKLIAVALLAATLTACGGMGDTKPEPAAVAPTPEVTAQGSALPAPEVKKSEAVDVLEMLKATDCESKSYESARSQSGSSKLVITLTDCELIDF